MTGQKRLVLAACILGTAVVFIDGTVVNVALPAIESDLGGGLAGQQWVSNAYLLALGSLLLIGGSLGDVFGERQLFSIGVIGFGVTSVLCALAPSIEVLVAARGLQGVAGALLTPAALAVIVATFGPDERGKAIGTWTAWAGIGTVFGPLLGGQLVDAASWRWIFAINVPLLVLTIVLIRRAMPPARPRPEGARLDVIGAALCALGLAGLSFGLINQPLHGWADPTVSVPLVAGATLMVGFLLWEARAPAPMLPLGLFRNHNFSAGNLETFAMYAGLSLLTFFLVLFLQETAGWSALEAGTATLPITVVMFLLSSRFGALADRLGPRLFMGLGPITAAAGIALMLRLDSDVSYATELLPAMVLFALGLAMTVAPLTATVLAGADESNAGIASGVNNAISRVAGLIAVAAVGAVVAAQFGARLDDELGALAREPAVARELAEAKKTPFATLDTSGLPAELRDRVAGAGQDASEEAFHVGMGIAAALAALGGLLGLVGIRNPERTVEAEECPGGQLVGVPSEGAKQSPCDWGRVEVQELR